MGRSERCVAKLKRGTKGKKPTRGELSGVMVKPTTVRSGSCTQRRGHRPKELFQR